MAIVGITLNKNNPSFNSNDFIFWMPQYTKFINTLSGQKYFNYLYNLANKKIFKSIYGSDWKLAISYCIAHYITLISNQLGAPSGSTLDQVAGGGNFRGVLSQATVGGFTKSYDIDKTLVDEKEAKFWNQTSYGASLMALLKTKAIPSMLVITNNNIRGTESCEKLIPQFSLFNDEIKDKWEYDINNIDLEIEGETAKIDFINKEAESSIIEIEINLTNQDILDLYLNGTYKIEYGNINILNERKFDHKNISINLKKYDVSNVNENILRVYILNDKETEDIFMGRLLVRKEEGINMCKKDYKNSLPVEFYLSYFSQRLKELDKKIPIITEDKESGDIIINQED